MSRTTRNRRVGKTNRSRPRDEITRMAFQKPVSAGAANGTTLRIDNRNDLISIVSQRSRHRNASPGDGLVVAAGANSENETYTVRIKPGKGSWTAIGLDVHQDESLPGNRLSRGADRFVLSELEADIDGRKLEFVLATSTGFGEMPEHAAMAAIDGNPNTGWGIGFGERRNPFLAIV